MSEGGRDTVLVVDDEPAVRDIIAEALRDDGHRVVEAQDGLEAIRLLRDHVPPPGRLCLVILDLMLPGADGLAVLRELAALGAYAPVLAVSADHGRLVRAEALGASATMGKPFDLERLLDTVRRCCPRRGGANR